ncbi:hypothetical protein H4J51_00220, partial [Colwellia sp. MB02u-18]|nr:hypothetical protein [Colwellia sp. MB3u-45]MBA6265931.1 hypothetical protein [Colwellia sp. MB3u-43]MBA6319620.1 hypothetical protein [Colwellia sp. MB02u-19]MBA6323000.1 hypothetical protein [Colwellia sp. MB02u-18]MBA6343374.1 hypothetical protein [Colwellia sp. MB02u-1]
MMPLHKVNNYKNKPQTTDQEHQIELWYLIAVAQRYAKTIPAALSSINELLKLDETH